MRLTHVNNGRLELLYGSNASNLPAVESEKWTIKLKKAIVWRTYIKYDAFAFKLLFFLYFGRAGLYVKRLPSKSVNKRFGSNWLFSYSQTFSIQNDKTPENKPSNVLTPVILAFL